MDARIVRTRTRLQEALFALTRERGLEEISVSDIVARAGVNRSTFYQHYSDKETLLADALDLIAEQSGAQLGDVDLGAAEPPAVLVSYLEHIAEHRDLYRRVYTEPGYGAVLARLRAHMMDAIRGAATQVGSLTPLGAPVEVVAAGVSGTVVGVIGAWLQLEEQVPPAEAALWVWRIVLGPPAGDAYAR
ncbi:TetR/AcrR family transcriptional regulator [Demequina silvatica]|uniref:TetR/AcrR family transcriptional regulator n=1 Tax=Demequina silvatica TaxID=1638988 RepID=UPI0007823BB1|nr:TetR/AcrR family transcriptional regulator [Demequina silvatica]